MEGCFVLLQRDTMQKTAQASSWEAALSQPEMGEIFCLPISRLESVKEVKVPPLRLRLTFLSENLLPTPSKVIGHEIEIC